MQLPILNDDCQISIPFLRRACPNSPPPVLHRIVKFILGLGTVNQPPLYLKVLAAICGHCRNEDGACWPGTRRLADLVGCHPNSVAREMRTLKAHGIVTVVRNPTEYPGRQWIYVVRDRAQFWFDSEAKNATSAYITRNGDSSSSIAPSVPHVDRHSNAPRTAKNAKTVKQRDIERFRAEVDQLDETVREQAYACLAVGVDVPMIRYLLKNFLRGERYMTGLLNRALTARKPAGFLVEGIIRKYSAVSDVETYRKHASREQRSRTPAANSAPTHEIRAAYHRLDDDQKATVREWLLHKHAENSQIGLWIRKRQSNALIWQHIQTAMIELQLT